MKRLLAVLMVCLMVVGCSSGISETKVITKIETNPVITTSVTSTVVTTAVQTIAATTTAQKVAGIDFTKNPVFTEKKNVILTHFSELPFIYAGSAVDIFPSLFFVYDDVYIVFTYGEDGKLFSVDVDPKDYERYGSDLTVREIIEATLSLPELGLDEDSREDFLSDMFSRNGTAKFKSKEHFVDGMYMEGFVARITLIPK